MSTDLPTSILFATTDLGESAVLGASVLACALYLLFSGGRRSAAALLLAFLSAAIAISILKILFLSCAARDSGITSPSGHMALSTAVFGTYAAIISAQIHSKRRVIPLLLLLPLILAIAITRVTLGYHTTPEVIVGLCVGGSIAFIIHRLLIHKHPREPFDARVLVALALAIIIIFHDIKFPGENLIHVLTAHIKRTTSLCNA